eukprot:s1191_g14.t1
MARPAMVCVPGVFALCTSFCAPFQLQGDQWVANSPSVLLAVGTRMSQARTSPSNLPRAQVLLGPRRTAPEGMTKTPFGHSQHPSFTMAEYVQPYAEALQERLVPFPEGEFREFPNAAWAAFAAWAEGSESEGSAAAADGNSDDDCWISPWDSGDMIGAPDVRDGYKLPSMDGSRMISLSLDGPSLVGYSMVGTEIFTASLAAGATTADVLEAASAALGAEPASLTLLCHGAPLEPQETPADFTSMAIRQKLNTGPAVYVCEQNTRREPDTFFGGSCEVIVNREKLPNPGIATIQALQETREFVTPHRFDCWLIYTKHEVLLYQRPSEKRRERDLLIPRGFFPPAPNWSFPAGSRRWGQLSDVWSACVEMPQIKGLMDTHADLTLDRPIPRYQMIVDPNQFVRQTACGPVWVPCEFDIDSEGRAQIVGGSRCHKYPALAEKVASPILEAALPLLAKLRRPQLLLDRRRLQIVFKAQRIILPPKVHEDDEPEYIGMWHVDGHREDVAAVVLYYYHVDPALEGGDMELCGREPFDILAIADAGDNCCEFHPLRLKEALAGEKQRLPHCRVPIEQGTLLVFSNHQMVHRVLRMINNGKSEASRDFVALFILNPASEALVPARCALAKPYMLTRVLRLKALTPDNIQVILSLAGFLPTDDESKSLRNAMLLEQLEPTGEFASRGNVRATGNGCLTMVGWLHHMLQDGRHGDGDFFSSFCGGWDHFRPWDVRDLFPPSRRIAEQGRMTTVVPVLVANFQEVAQLLVV